MHDYARGEFVFYVLWILVRPFFLNLSSRGILITFDFAFNFAFVCCILNSSLRTLHLAKEMGRRGCTMAKANGSMLRRWQAKADGANVRRTREEGEEDEEEAQAVQGRKQSSVWMFRSSSKRI